MQNGRTILVVGEWRWPWYQEACARSLGTLGWQVIPFSWVGDFHRSSGVGPNNFVYRSKIKALQNKLLIGPVLNRINARLLQAVAEAKPDIIWLYNATHIFASTVSKLKQIVPASIVAQYSNDDPFGSHVKPDYFRHFKRSIPLCDKHFIYRLHNRDDFKKAGASGIQLLRSYYVPSDDYRVALGTADEQFRSDVVFIGHYEKDGRLEHLDALLQRGHRTKIYGTGWQSPAVAPEKSNPLLGQFPIVPAYGDEYRKAISGSKIALAFLSKINRDTYTRRNFQIPAMGTFMLSEYSDDLATLFKEGVEAEFFRDRDELLDKTSFYLKHDEARDRIARQGYERVRRDGHDVRNRMKEFSQHILRC